MYVTYRHGPICNDHSITKGLLKPVDQVAFVFNVFDRTLNKAEDTVTPPTDSESQGYKCRVQQSAITTLDSNDDTVHGPDITDTSIRCRRIAIQR